MRGVADRSRYLPRCQLMSHTEIESIISAEILGIAVASSVELGRRRNRVTEMEFDWRIRTGEDRGVYRCFAIGGEGSGSGGFSLDSGLSCAFDVCCLAARLVII